MAPTCGAVVAAAVIMKPGCHRIPGVRDSKTLSMAQRERLAPIIRRRAVAIGVGAASVREIDQLNIYHATHLAMRRAIARVGGHEHVLVDGNRIAGFEAPVGPYTNIVDGDAKVYSIACASVVAKVVRDRMMAKLAARYPGYGWEHNQGYATRDHRDAIRAMGLTPFHRRSFLALQRTLAGDQLDLDLLGRSGRLARRPRAASSASCSRSWPTTRRSTPRTSRPSSCCPSRSRWPPVEPRRRRGRVAGGWPRYVAGERPASPSLDVDASDPAATSRTPAQQAGDAAETLVAARLEAAGWTVLARNIRVGRGELDLVAIDPGPPSDARHRRGALATAPGLRPTPRRRSTTGSGPASTRPPSRCSTAATCRRLPLRFDLVVVEPAAGEGSRASATSRGLLTSEGCGRPCATLRRGPGPVRPSEPSARLT